MWEFSFQPLKVQKLGIFKKRENNWKNILNFCFFVVTTGTLRFFLSQNGHNCVIYVLELNAHVLVNSFQ